MTSVMQWAAAPLEVVTMTPDPWRTPCEGDVLLELGAMVREQRAGVLATVVRTERSTPRQPGAKMIVHPDGRLTGSIGGGAAEAHVVACAGEVAAGGECRIVAIDLDGGHGVCGGRMEIFLEPVLRAVPFVLVGGGHVGRAMVEVGRTLPFRFLLVDDRADILEGLPDSAGVRTVACGPGALANHLAGVAGGAVLVASRGHAQDADYLEALLRAEPGLGRQFVFIGLLGSRVKTAITLKELEQRGVPAPALGRVRAPVGLDLGDETPAEIALAVLAEALAVVRGREFLKDEAGRELGVRLRSRRT
ncbi:MAG: XdhC family protein [bacterium]|nr:XdhC family protein [bacterium]